MENEDLTESTVRTVAGLFPLDWKTTDVKLGDGRFSHTLRHPSAEELFARDADMQTEIPIGKDGSYKLPDPTANEPLDAKFHDVICVDTQGYSGEPATRFKAAAVNHLYKREWDIAEGFSIFDDQIEITEELGSGETPDFTITHRFRQPNEDELRMYRRKSGAGEMKPGKRGKQVFVTRSDLRTAVDFYAKWIVAIFGATVDGEVFYEHNAEAFIDAVDAPIKRAAVQTFAAKLNEALLD